MVTAVPDVVLCSKSAWEPAIRREHAFAREAVRHGHAVTFVERALDVRAATRRADRRRYLEAFSGRGGHTAEGVRVEPLATIVPGHRSSVAEATSAWFLRQRLLRLCREGTSVVAWTPWQWPAVARLGSGVRKVFDLTDDWSELIPARRDAIRGAYGRIAAEADAVVLASEDMRPLFAGADVHVVRNAVEAWFARRPPAPRVSERRLLYLGTLSPRFDAPLVRRLLTALPGWTLDLYGQAQYPGRGERPDEELEELLSLGPARVRWRGLVPRERVPEVIDAAAVALLPNRPELTSGQDSLKLYDFASRGIPVVTTRWSDDLPHVGPPHLYVGDDLETLVEHVHAAAGEPEEHRRERQDWAANHTWDARWPHWAAAVFGSEERGAPGEA